MRKQRRLRCSHASEVLHATSPNKGTPHFHSFHTRPSPSACADKYAVDMLCVQSTPALPTQVPVPLLHLHRAAAPKPVQRVHPAGGNNRSSLSPYMHPTVKPAQGVCSNVQKYKADSSKSFLLTFVSHPPLSRPTPIHLRYVWRLLHSYQFNESTNRSSPLSCFTAILPVLTSCTHSRSPQLLTTLLCIHASSTCQRFPGYFNAARLSRPSSP